MSKKVSDKQKLLRVFLAGAISILYLYNVIDGILAYILMGIAILLLISALINYK